jgi:hypothetical protein
MPIAFQRSDVGLHKVIVNFHQVGWLCRDRVGWMFKPHFSQTISPEIVQKINGRNNYRLKEIKSAVFQAFSN